MPELSDPVLTWVDIFLVPIRLPISRSEIIFGFQLKKKKSKAIEQPLWKSKRERRIINFHLMEDQCLFPLSNTT